MKNLTEPWPEYGPTNNTGHFVPLKLPVICKDKEVTLKGRTDGDRKVTVDDDLFLVVRLENLAGTTMTVEMNDAELMKLDFTSLIPVGEDAYDPEKKDFGSYGKRSDYVQDLNIVWDGVKGTATGTLLKHELIGNKVKAGYHFPLGMTAWYDNIAKDVTIKDKKTIKDKDIICNVEESKTITVEYNGITVLELDLTGMTVGQ